ncbi:MAG: nitroreductase [Burkholderiaceae bacterium]|nr:nitroreductase [Burkholderiaceae bacterium]
MSAMPDTTPLPVTLEQCLRARHSCRAFLPQPVPRQTIEKILTTAQLTASWCNAQPWRVHLLSGAALERFRAALLQYTESAQPTPDIPWPREYRNEYLARRRESGFQLYDAVGIAKGDRAAALRQARENFRLFGAPHVAIISSDEALGPYGAVDCGAYVNSFLLAAATEGVASIPQAALASHARFLHGELKIAEDRLIVCAISFGYEDTAHPANSYRTSRAPLDEVVTWLND